MILLNIYQYFYYQTLVLSASYRTFRTTEPCMIEKYFPSLSEKQLSDFNKLPALYAEWNEKINVISRRDMEQMMLHHVLHSLSIAKFVTFVNGTRIIDVGTGGGFPGIPLAIFFPEVDFLLVDSVGKKIMVVNEIVKGLKLQNVRAVKSRAEDLDSRCDFVVSRAVAPVRNIIRWTENLITPGGKNSVRNGWIFLKGGNLKEELRGLEDEMLTIDIPSMFDDPYFEEKKIVYITL
jgi:16S rRNA (guanine527-N7)-methyltransferase